MEKQIPREEELKSIYRLKKHPEGGWYREAYTSPFEIDGRPIAGSIFFLLGKSEFSRLHVIDCDEIWFYHEGCGMRITSLSDKGKEVFALGGNALLGERAMTVVPAGSVFAAENADPDGYTFVSCVTAPQFSQEGFREIDRDTLKSRYPVFADETSHLAF